MGKSRQTINSFCIAIKNITNKEIKEMRELARAQQEYISPLKMLSQSKMNNMGKRNNEILDKIVELKELIRKNKPRQFPNTTSDLDLT